MNYPKRSCTHRMKGHDYRATWKYHLTLLKNPDAPYFCHLADGWREAALTHRREAVKMEYTPAEKAIRVEAEVLGARHILITHTPMPDRYKPAAHDFDLCAAAAIKVIARMFGLRFDTLWQRHERAKRRRRLSVIAGVILFSLISFSVGAYMVEKPTPSPQSASDPPLKCPGLSLQACILFFCLSVLLSSPPRLFV